MTVKLHYVLRQVASDEPNLSAAESPERPWRRRIAAVTST
jgi:hypothetical protein